MAWTVLLVDDSRTIQEVVRLSFLKTEFELIVADNGEDGLALAKEAIPEVVLADVRMPGMDGYDLCRLLKEDEATSRIPVLLFIGQNVEQDINRSKEVRAMGFFPKPFYTQELLDQVTMLCQAQGVAVEQADEEEIMEIAEEPMALPSLAEASLEGQATPPSGADTVFSGFDSVATPREDQAIAPETGIPTSGSDALVEDLWEEPDGLDVIITEEVAQTAGADEDKVEGEIDLDETGLAYTEEPAEAEDVEFLEEELDLDETGLAFEEELEEEAGPVSISDDEASLLLEEIESDDLDQAYLEEPIEDELDDIEIEDMDDIEFEVEDEADLQALEPASLTNAEKTEMERLRKVPLSEISEQSSMREEAAAEADIDPYGLGFETVEGEGEAVQQAEASVEAETAPAGEAEAFDEKIDLDEIELEDVDIESIEMEEVEVEPDDIEELETEGVEFDLTMEAPEQAVEESLEAVEIVQHEVLEELPLETGEPETEMVQEFTLTDEVEELPEAEEMEVLTAAEAAMDQRPVEEEEKAVSGYPSPDDILSLFRQAIREELGAMMAPEAPVQTNIEKLVREAVRDEVAVSIKDLAAAAGGDPSGAQSDLSPLAPEIREVGERINQLESTVTEQLAHLYEKLQSFETASNDVDLSGLEEKLGNLSEALQELSTMKHLGEEMHTWINSALTEVPSGEEIRQILKESVGTGAIPQVSADQASTDPAAAGETSDIVRQALHEEMAELTDRTVEAVKAAAPQAPAGDLSSGEVSGDQIRQAIREEFGSLTSQTLEAVIWEVVPDLAERIIKKELDRLTADHV